MIVQDSIHSTIPLYEQSFSDFNNIKLSTNKIVFIKVRELFLCTFLLLNKLMITKFKKYSNMADLFNEIFNDKSKSLKTKCVVLGISAKKTTSYYLDVTQTTVITYVGCCTKNCDNICCMLHKQLYLCTLFLFSQFHMVSFSCLFFRLLFNCTLHFLFVTLAYSLKTVQKGQEILIIAC